MGSNKNNAFWHVEWSARITYCRCRQPNTKTQLLWPCISAVWCIHAGVHVRVFTPCVWWSSKMVCDMRKARGHNTESYWLLLILDSLVFFSVMWQEASSYLKAALTFPLLGSFIFSQHRFDLDRRCGGGTEGERKRERERQGEGERCWFSLSLSVEALSAF